MRRAWLIALLGLAACSSSGGGGLATGSTTSTTEATTTTAVADRDMYLAELDLMDGVGGLDGIDPDRLVGLGEVACDELDQGGTLRDVLDRLQAQPEFGPREPAAASMGAVPVAAAANLCPEHYDALAAEINETR